jgi:hypothetical protein
MMANGTRLKQLTNGGGNYSPEWSPPLQF